MILNFMLTFPGKEKRQTFFREKIVKCIIELGTFTEEVLKINQDIHWISALILTLPETISKKHTIREDKNNRWKPGMWIDFFINARTKKMFRFAPRIKVVSVQKISIEHDLFFGKHLGPQVLVDNKKLSLDKLELLAKNDGFDNIEEFFQWFDKDFTGKIIHWTDLKY